MCPMRRISTWCSASSIHRSPIRTTWICGIETGHLRACSHTTSWARCVDTGGNPSTAWPYAASGNYFDALGIQPYLGRFFHAADERGMKSAPYVVLSYEYWHSHFDDDAGVVGRSVEINKHPLTIIGVAPPAFRGTELFFSAAMWIPMVEEPLVRSADTLSRSNHSR